MVTDYTDVATDNANIKVYVRLRPPDHGQPAADFLQVMTSRLRVFWVFAACALACVEHSIVCTAVA